MSRSDLDRLCVHKIRTLAIDAIQKAKSGHPGARWAWRRYLWAAAEAAQLRSRIADMAEPRPIHSLRRPRIEAALCVAPSI
jgi:Transketolase, thiamine diphosphate binding domain